VKIYDYYIIILAGLFLITTVILAALNETRLGFCFFIYLIETLTLNELCIYLNPGARRSLNTVNYVLFAGFSFIVAAEVVKIIWSINAIEMLWGVIEVKVIEIFGSVSL